MIRFKLFLESTYKAQDGESEILHHATASSTNFTNFRPLSHFGTKQAARTRIKSNEIPNNSNNTTANFKSVRLKLGNTVSIEDSTEGHSPYDIANGLHNSGHISVEDRDSVHNSYEHKSNYKQKMSPRGRGIPSLQLLHVLRKNNINSIHYVNKVEDPGSSSYIITHPNQVRVLKSGVVSKK